MSPEEQHDHDALKIKQAELRRSAFSLCQQFLRMDTTALKTAGHTTIDAAIRYTIERSLREITKVETEYFRKWPD